MIGLHTRCRNGASPCGSNWLDWVRTRSPQKWLMSKTILYLIPLLPLVALSPSRAIVWSDVTPVLFQDQAAAQADNEDTGNDAAIRELELFRAAKVPLRRAIAIAEELHAGSRAADVTFDSSSGSAVYKVRTTRKSWIWENAIDGKTGRVAGRETVLSLENLDTEDRNNFVALKDVRQKLSVAVLIAEKAADGKAIGASLLNKDGKLHFLVLIVSDDHLKEVILEPPRATRP